MDTVLPFAESLARLKESFLWAAAKGGHAEDCLSLLEYGADVNWVSPEGDTALIAACRGGHSQVVELLLSHGADVDQQAPDGTTALHCCVQRGDQSLVKLLLEAGCSTALANARGQTAHAIAMQKGFRAIAELVNQHAARDAPAGELQQAGAADGGHNGTAVSTTARQRDIRRLLPRVNAPSDDFEAIDVQQLLREERLAPVVHTPVLRRREQEEQPEWPIRSARASRLEAEHLQERAQQLQQENEELRARIQHYQGNSLQGLTVAELEHLEHELRHAIDAVTKRKVLELLLCCFCSWWPLTD